MLNYDEISPLFGKINDVLTIESTFVFSVQEYYGVTFVSHFDAFVINSRDVASAVCVNFLADHHIFSHLTISILTLLLTNIASTILLQLQNLKYAML